jgi:hypothetical protein
VNIQDGGLLAFSSRNISKTKQDMLKLQNNLLNALKACGVASGPAEQD